MNCMPSILVIHGNACKSAASHENATFHVRQALLVEAAVVESFLSQLSYIFRWGDEATNSFDVPSDLVGDETFPRNDLILATFTVASLEPGEKVQLSTLTGALGGLKNDGQFARDFRHRKLEGFPKNDG